MISFHYTQNIRTVCSIASNIIWSMIYFKQLFYPSTNSYIINLSGIALLPFIYFIAALFVLTIPEKKINVLKSPGMISSIIFSVALVALFIVLGKYNYIYLLYFVLVEPLKVKFIENGAITHLKVKFVALAIISFLLLAIGTVLPTFNAPVNAAAMWMAGFYFLILNIIDYKLPAELQKNKKESRT